MAEPVDELRIPPITDAAAAERAIYELVEKVNELVRTVNELAEEVANYAA